MRWTDDDAPGMPFALTPGAVHEWIGPCEPSADRAGRAHPPLLPLCHFALEQWSRGTWAVWIGRDCWPHAGTLATSARARPFINRWLFVDAARPIDRVWAAELCLRCPSVSVVIADASRMLVNESRRLQLAAKSGSALALLARPPSEIGELSCAASRWLVRREPSPTDRPRWTVELLRCKGVQPAPERSRVWTLEWDREACGIRVPADVARRSAAATAEANPSLRIA